MPDLPIHNAICGYAEKETARFHMPGHKGILSAFDVTEVTGTDNLHSPKDAILRSEALCAEALKARDAFFSVNGSSAAVMCMLALLGTGKQVLLARNCHISAVNGAALAGHITHPIFPDENGVITAETAEKAFEERHYDAVFITSPTYRGVCSPVDRIAAVAHEHGALLLVDSAHGAHFAFSDMLPPVPSSADLWCVSTHKTLDALTQTAVLLAGEGCPIERERIRRSLSLFQSTSPSYLLMLSIERALLMPSDWDAHIKRIAELSDRIAAVPGVELLYRGSEAVYDVTRLNIRMSGMTGYDLAAKLEEAGIVPEMSDGECVTLITTPSDDPDWYERLYERLVQLAEKTGANEETGSKGSAALPEPGECKVSVREAVLGEYELVSLHEAVGLVAAKPVGCYPPGISILFPGETITSENASYLLDEERRGAVLFGTEDGMIAVLRKKV